MTANDSDVSNGDTLTGSQVVRVYGENLTAPFVTLTFGGVEYTPLYQGEGYIEFFIGDNGTAIIAVDGSRFMSFEVEGITIPAGLTGKISAGLDNDTGGVPVINVETTETGCLKYPFFTSETYPYIHVYLFKEATLTIGEDDITFVNCNLNRLAVDSGGERVSVWVSVVDVTKPCYLIYEGFIFFVGNYTTD